MVVRRRGHHLAKSSARRVCVVCGILYVLGSFVGLGNSVATIYNQE